MENEKVYVNDFIEKYEEWVYGNYKTYLSRCGRDCAKTNAAYKEWKNVLSFVDDYNVSVVFSLDDFKAAIDDMGDKLVHRGQDKEFEDRWVATTKMYYAVLADIRRNHK